MFLSRGVAVLLHILDALVSNSDLETTILTDEFHNSPQSFNKYARIAPQIKPQ
jgi:hypothetical protein